MHLVCTHGRRTQERQSRRKWFMRLVSLQSSGRLARQVSYDTFNSSREVSSREIT